MVPQTQDPERDSVENKIESLMDKASEEIDLDELVGLKNANNDELPKSK